MRDSLTVRPYSNIFGRIITFATSATRTGSSISMQIMQICGVILTEIISYARSLNVKRRSLLSFVQSLTLRLTVWISTVD